jgi:hypothetical protein
MAEPPIQGPVYPLLQVHGLMRTGKWEPTGTALSGAGEMDMDAVDIRKCVLRLRPTDYYHTLRAELRPGLFQDVYRPMYNEQRVFLKLQIVEAYLTVISFKEKNPGWS